jgi:hypothetical protein
MGRVGTVASHLSEEIDQRILPPAGVETPGRGQCQRAYLKLEDDQRLLQGF